MGFNGPVDLNLLAVDKVMDYMEIDNSYRMEVYLKVQKISSRVLKKARQIAKKSQPKK